MEHRKRNPAARKLGIEQVINARNTVTVEELCTLLGASPATIRRDLAELEAEGAIRRTFGGASLRRLRPAEQAFAVREQIEIEAKRAIAKASIRHIGGGDTIFLNDGTTVMAVAREIVTRKLEIQVATPQVNVALVLSACPAVTVILIGGSLSHTAIATSGMFTEDMIDRINADVALISSDGLSVDDGLTFASAQQASVATHMIRKARKSIALVTGSKFDERGSISAAPASVLSTIITNAIPFPLAARFNALGVDVECTAMDMQPATFEAHTR